MSYATHTIPWTLTRGDREIDGTVSFTVIPAEKPTRTYPGCDGGIDDVLFMDHDREIPVTDEEVGEIEARAAEVMADSREE